MLVNDFDYYLPEELIAQTPLEKRSTSRLLVVDRKTGKLEDRHFYEIIDYLDSNDVLVINNTKVLPSRIYGKKVDTNANIEVLLLKEIDDYWEVLVRPFRRVKVGSIINFGNLFTGQVIKKLEEGICHIRFKYEGIFLNLLDQLGEMPLPPYIHEKLEEKDRYQTIYAEKLGSAAAPTAGLHFDEELLEKVKAKGIEIVNVTLHIGLGTFRSVSVEKIEDHKMHSEHYYMCKEAADKLNEAKAKGKRIISVGTTTTRTLESIYTKYNEFREVSEDTNIFIYPGYEFKAIDALITNFHLPKSTLIMLVSAFYSREKILKVYEHAVKERYRFFSFGDAMFIK
ncbi:MAG TPA: tRNA preQ1(34) S-adenosylmethionine ribosyltransferase-isomerase QueA [Acholeplasmataceae bacterium]|nr:tRNA preQ1(34) S-adenosylmethionine ribosyltransferase-isomerase QueA [Acholeplasmataceae bacterium]